MIKISVKVLLVFCVGNPLIRGIFYKKRFDNFQKVVKSNLVNSSLAKAPNDDTALSKMVQQKRRNIPKD